MLRIRTERRIPAIVALPFSRCRSATAWLRIRVLWRRELGRGNMEIRVERSGFSLVTRQRFVSSQSVVMVLIVRLPG